MKKLFAVRTLLLAMGLGLIPADRAIAQSFTVLHSFTARPFSTNYDGAYPAGRLIANASGNTLYGTANLGGSRGYGTVFAVNTDGTGLTNLHSFNYFTEGSQPLGGLVLSGSRLYGTAWQGGTGGGGSVFALNTDGSGFTNLRNFSARSGPLSTNSDGANARAGLVLSSNGATLYGTAEKGGSAGFGTVFKITTNGTGFTNLLKFTSSVEGIYPVTDLILSGDTLYGTTAGSATLYAIRTNGTGFTSLHSLDYASEGLDPGVLLLLGNTLYGVASSGGTEGGSTGNGTLFSLSFTPQLTINRSATNVILTWPTNVAGFDYTGFTLQSTTNLSSPAVWITNSVVPTVINGENTVTNPASEPQRFFRLKAP